MRFHVLGIGPIGSLVAHHLRRALPPAHSIVLMHRTLEQSRRSASSGEIQVEHGGVIETQRGFEYEVFKTLDTNSRPAGATTHPIESLFVTTKAHQVLPAIRPLLPRLSHASAIVLLHNGMGVYEQLVHELFPNPNTRPHFILASNTHGAWLKDRSPPHVVHAGIGRILFGIIPDPLERDFELGLRNESVPVHERKLSFTDIANPPVDHAYAKYLPLRNTVAALLAMDSLNTQWLPISTIQVEIRRKLVVNSVINPLTAILRARNGDIFGTRESIRLAHRVCKEASAVFRAQMQAEADVAQPQKTADTTVKQGESKTWKRKSMNEALGVKLPRDLHERELLRACLEVAKSTGENFSSMLKDLLQGLSPFEIEYLNGYLLKLGNVYNVPMPATATLRDLAIMRFAIPIDQSF
ncbi:ketopantoate reductase-like protein [Punctularia strigosozonata HHB-11173 SS5]|uniref:ketopantoate reductase-like protein n=1 Tax=Punctularia strigosozonata (strain HHB-11173) TaxID=741275 RepID=UPI00044178B3|nr:ketopantoate reductase-like protein [Punctularia strigosozonata HHB-11173 SS5]EIN13961.1 ketopantoate reductase-like protein [Punctularia strigosozonata HHB-11173 SS5]